MTDDGSQAATDRTRARDLLERGYRLQLEGRGEDAVRDLRRSIALSPSALAHVLLGWALAQGGNVDDAIAECLAAIRLDPQLGNAWSDLGAYLLEKGDDDRARTYLAGALSMKRFERHHYAHANLGRVHRRQGLLVTALHEYRRAVELEPRNAAAKKAIREILRNFN